MAATAYPPAVTLPNSSRPVKQSEAHQLLSSYLARSATNPHLHPDALLQPSGPTFSVQGGPQGGLVLHQLRRVEAGLRGEILKPDPALREQEGDDGKLDALIAESQSQLAEQESTPGKRKGGLKRKAGDWDETEVFDATHGVTGDGDVVEDVVEPLVSDDEVDVAKGAETGEMGDRSNVVEDGGEVPTVRAVSKTQAEKDAKKAAKKARKQQDKKDRATQRQAAGSQVSAPPEKERSEEGKKKKKRQREAAD